MFSNVWYETGAFCNGSAEFDELGAAARAMGFKHVASGPLVRSSYHADLQAKGEVIS